MDELTQRCIELANIKHEIGVALEEYDAGDHDEAIGRLRELAKS